MSFLHFLVQILLTFFVSSDIIIHEVIHMLGCEKIYINSQKHAIGFYEKFGFEVTSEEFLEAGIPHKSMELTFK